MTRRYVTQRHGTIFTGRRLYASMADVVGRFSEDRDRLDALVSLLAAGAVAYLKDGEEHSEADEANPLFEGASTCFTSSFVQADSLDFRQEEDS